MSDDVEDPLGDEIMGKGPRRRVNVLLPPRPEVPEEAVEQGTRVLAEKWKESVQVRPAETCRPSRTAAGAARQLTFRPAGLCGRATGH